ncbi:hypothetical protein [Pleomorphomonas oryzae]|uniref:hypothetical protein n=1 Tax=Pleomorphomonas oryzae TaxID=261934 RepID=UPI0003FA3910|nr:hypothetical protein [Pleomorphomonas oryzae]
MRVILFSVGLVGIAFGMLALVFAQSAIHQILAAVSIFGGFTLIGLAAVMHTVDAACDRLIGAMWAPPPAKEDIEG